MALASSPRPAPWWHSTGFLMLRMLWRWGPGLVSLGITFAALASLATGLLAPLAMERIRSVLQERWGIELSLDRWEVKAGQGLLVRGLVLAVPAREARVSVEEFLVSPHWPALLNPRLDGLLSMVRLRGADLELKASRAGNPEPEPGTEASVSVPEDPAIEDGESLDDPLAGLRDEIDGFTEILRAVKDHPFTPRVLEVEDLRAHLGDLEPLLVPQGRLSLGGSTLKAHGRATWRDARITLTLEADLDRVQPRRLDLELTDLSHRWLPGTGDSERLQFAGARFTLGVLARDASGPRTRFSWDLALEVPRSVVRWDLLAPEPVDLPPLALKLGGEVRWDQLADLVLPSSAGTLSLGPLAFALDLALEPRPVPPGSSTTDEAPAPSPGRQVSVGGRLDPSPVGDILRAVPPVILGSLAQVGAQGTIGWEGRLRLPLSEPGAFTIEGKLDTQGIRITSFPAEFDLFHLNDAFLFTPHEPQAPWRQWYRFPAHTAPSDELISSWSGFRVETVERIRLRKEATPLPGGPYFGPGPRKIARIPEAAPAEGLADLPVVSPREVFAPLDTISPYLVKAVLTAEDGDFFYHQGIDWNTFRDAVARNISRGEVQVGASTISMQVIKNLLLDEQQVLNRKIQEALLVHVLEMYSPVTKARILEIYLNLAEFGPGVTGVREAAAHYFATTPDLINLEQAVWLASMLPSPRRYSTFVRSGRPADFWVPRMDFYLEVMHRRGRITDEEFAAARPAELRFPGLPETPATPAADPGPTEILEPAEP